MSVPLAPELRQHHEIVQVRVGRRVVVRRIGAAGTEHAGEPDHAAVRLRHEDPAVERSAALEEPAQIGLHDRRAGRDAGVELALHLLELDEATAEGRIVRRAIFADGHAVPPA